MSDLRNQIRDAIAKEMEQSQAPETTDVSKEIEQLAPEMQDLAGAFPALMTDDNYESVEIEVEKEKKEEEEREKRKRLSASERYKRNLIREREENLRLRNELYERDLKTKVQEKEKREIAYNFIDSQIKLLSKENEEAALLEDHYTALGEFENARQSRQKQNEHFITLQKLKEAKQKIEYEYKLYDNEVNQTSKNRPFNYIPSVEDEPADEDQRANYQEFVKKNPFLNPEDQINYIPEASRLADQIHDEVVKLYKIRGHGDQVGSKAFFEDVGRITKEKITGVFDNRNGNVNHNSIGAPSTRKLALDNKVQLTKEEARLRTEYEKRFGKEYMKEYDAILKHTKQSNM